MLTFPTISRSPHLDGFTEKVANDNTYKASFESGHVITRARYTRLPKAWGFQFTYITTADKLMLEQFQEGVALGGDSFYWEHFKTSNIHEVRLAKPMDFTLEAREPDLWRVKIEIEEV